MQTSRQGIFVAGPFSEPKDIPESIIEASGAASLSAIQLATGRNSLTVKREYPPERDVSGEEQRIGVFVCHCGATLEVILMFLKWQNLQENCQGWFFRKTTFTLLSGHYCSYHRANKKPSIKPGGCCLMYTGELMKRFSRMPCVRQV